jgi:hypothetical protein
MNWLRAERHPAYRWPDFERGDRRYVGTFGVDASGKAASGLNHEGERTDATPRGGVPR